MLFRKLGPHSPARATIETGNYLFQWVFDNQIDSVNYAEIFINFPIHPSFQLFNRERGLLPGAVRQDVLKADGLQLPGGYIARVLQELWPQSKLRYPTLRLYRVRRIHFEGPQVPD